MVEVFLMYDTDEEGVLLRFGKIRSFHVKMPPDGNEVSCLNGSQIVLLPHSAFVWIADDSYDAEDPGGLDKMKDYATWIEAGRLIWAVTNAKGDPVEFPKDRTDQTFSVWGREEHRHFEFRAASGTICPESSSLPVWSFESIGSYGYSRAAPFPIMHFLRFGYSSHWI